MGTQYIGTGRILVGLSQDVAIGAASAASTAVSSETFKIRVKVTSDCRVRISQAPTAVSTDTYMSAGDVEWFTCNPGEKIACIQVSGAGIMNVTEGY